MNSLIDKQKIRSYLVKTKKVQWKSENRLGHKEVDWDFIHNFYTFYF